MTADATTIRENIHKTGEVSLPWIAFQGPREMIEALSAKLEGHPRFSQVASFGDSDSEDRTAVFAFTGEAIKLKLSPLISVALEAKEECVTVGDGGRPDVWGVFTNAPVWSNSWSMGDYPPVLMQARFFNHVRYSGTGGDPLVVSTVLNRELVRVDGVRKVEWYYVQRCEVLPESKLPDMIKHPMRELVREFWATDTGGRAAG